MNDNEKKQLEEKELDEVSGGLSNPFMSGKFVWKKCKSCGDQYRTIKSDTVGICPDCKKNPNKGKIL